MAKNTRFVDREFLDSVALPQATERYTVIPHDLAVRNMQDAFRKHGLKIKNESYKVAEEGQIAIGTFTLNHGDGEMDLMAGFINSYNKKVSFKYSIGSRVIVCENGMLVGDTTFKKKHMGDVDKTAFISFDTDIQKVTDHFTYLKELRENMKDIPLSKKEMAELAGRLFIEDEIINATQLSIIKGQIHNPSYDYGTKNNTVWDAFSHCTHSAKKFHPTNYLEGHQQLSEFFISEFGLVTPKEEVLILS